MNTSFGISIVIPAYNESARLGATLDRVLNFVRQQDWDAEVIVVDDGSRDRTADLVRDCAQANPIVRLVQNPGNRGKGYSVRSGLLQALGDVVMFTDADLSAPIEEAERLFAAIAAGADIAMLDEFSLDGLREAVATNRGADRPLKLEASGGVTPQTIRDIALTGVDYISVGSITKHVRAVDLSMRFEWQD